MQAYRTLLTLGALTLAGLVATMVVRGGLQAIAAAIAVLAGAGFALTFAMISGGPRLAG